MISLDCSLYLSVYDVTFPEILLTFFFSYSPLPSQVRSMIHRVSASYTSTICFGRACRIFCDYPSVNSSDWLVRPARGPLKNIVQGLRFVYGTTAGAAGALNTLPPSRLRCSRPLNPLFSPLTSLSSVRSRIFRIHPSFRFTVFPRFLLNFWQSVDSPAFCVPRLLVLIGPPCSVLKVYLAMSSTGSPWANPFSPFQSDADEPLLFCPVLDSLHKKLPQMDLRLPFQPPWLYVLFFLSPFNPPFS